METLALSHVVLCKPENLVQKDTLVWGLSFAELREAQHGDNELEIIMVWLEKQETPSERDLFIASPEAKKLLAE